MTTIQRVIVLAVVLVLGVLAIVRSWGWHGKSGVFETTRNVPMNHRFIAGDVEAVGFRQRILSWSTATTRSFEGRYAKGPIGSGDPVGLADTSAAPVLHAPSDTFLYWTPVDATATADFAALDAGTEVEVCGLDVAEQSCLTHARVAVISCDEKRACSAGLWIRRQRRPLLLTALDRGAAAKSSRIRIYVRRP